MAWLNYHHLMYFRSIAIHGSISKASEQLLVGQPALSAQLKSLEEFFGHKLFERENRRLKLTDAGKSTLKYANKIHELGVELQEMLQDKNFSARPNINLGFLDSVPKDLIVRLVKAVYAISEAQITVLEGSGEDLYAQLVSHSLDIVVSNYHMMPKKDRSIYTKSIGKFPIGIYGIEKFKGLKSKFPNSLAGEPLILPTMHSKLSHDIERFFIEKKVTCKVVLNAQDTSTQKTLALDGIGMIAAPDFSVEPLVKAKRLFKIGTLDGLNEEFFVITTKRLVENSIIGKLLQSFTLLK